MKSRNEYKQLLKSGMFWEFHPELSGEWKNDRLKWLEIQGVINKDSNWFDKLRAILDNQTKEESDGEWDAVTELNLVGPTVEEYFSGPYFGDGKQVIYEAMYNPCYHESCSTTFSLHKTRKGAESAIEAHKAQIKVEFDEMYHNPEYPVDFIVDDMKFDDNMFWSIKETILED